ncbi:hypothetical protein SAMN02949497_0518 [Methylomagnum ishizawai]|uniref:Uncharacterized protein n=1 Tax=Methylomagnum ishizawai TaxID=1760988 RepID=A0A1Y6D3G6_9GAMM|nr:hypothetical protein [Methylomagnum ishizawai]SMF97488.1 hypothetical protein SAMN02949497_0518 [Methylomagnum ishizawai]
MNTPELTWRMLAETGRLPYFGGAGLGLLPALFRIHGPWRTAVCATDPASPVLDWLRHNTEAELYLFPVPGAAGSAVWPQGSWDSGTVPTLLGGSERDWLDVGGIAHGLGSRPQLRRCHVLDEALDPDLGLGLILTDIHGSAGLVRGAVRHLASARPALLIARGRQGSIPLATTELLAVAATLAEAGYLLHDSTLTPLNSRDGIEAALRDWRETVFLGLPAGLALALLDAPGEAVTPAGFAAARDRAAWAYLGEYRRPPAVPARIHLQADAIPDAAGFYPAENWEDLRWRWTGPKPRATARVPLPRPGRYRLACRLLKVADGRVLETLRVFVNGQALDLAIEQGEHDIGLAGEFVAGLARFQPVAEILFTHSETYTINPDDPRRLGLALMDIEIERGDY